MPLTIRRQQGIDRFDPHDYDQCVRDSTRLGNGRRSRHAHLVGQTVHHDEFEKDAIGIIGECEFARFAGLSVASIYSTQSGDADFVYEGYQVEVKAFAFDPRRPNRSCSLLVRVEDIAEIPSDFYVLWSVNIADMTNHPVGWATYHDVKTAKTGVLSEKTGYVNHIVPKNKLRPLRDFKPWVTGLRTMQELPDGRIATITWDTSRLSARIETTDTRDVYLYRGNSGQSMPWYSTLTTDHAFANAQSAVEGVLAALCPT